MARVEQEGWGKGARSILGDPSCVTSGEAGQLRAPLFSLQLPLPAVTEGFDALPGSHSRRSSACGNAHPWRIIGVWVCVDKIVITAVVVVIVVVIVIVVVPLV